MFVTLVRVKSAIRPNLAKRGLAKLCISSMCGKLTERNDRTRTKMISEPQELHRFLATPGIEVANQMFASDDVVWASWRFIAEEKGPCLRHTNEAISAYVPAGARIHLYRYMDGLQEKAIYCDMNCVFYIQKANEPQLIECGHKLGDMTNELRPREYMEKFVSAGPKNYAYKTINSATNKMKNVCEDRGVTLN